MSQIRILSDHLANQIAAGEVVERPASVVKELLENSLDAGADRVDIQVEGGGTRLIRIVDNGMGMDADDVMLSIERHATSKLVEESQLAAIATLGFRGEALPSIGSVSRMIILSRTRDADIGTRAEIRFGSLRDVHEAGCARGTVIEVRSLFGNLPARKKFLKTRRTELAHIEEVIRSQSLAHPGIAFNLQVDERKKFTFPAADSEQRMRDVFHYQDSLLPLKAESGKEDGLQLGGFLLLPDAAVLAKLRILVNSRPIQDRMIRHAVVEGLQGFLMKRASPAGVLLLELSPELIDINVHPAKQEIRFRRANEVHRFIVHAVSEAIRQYQQQVRSELFALPDPVGGATEPEPVADLSGLHSAPAVPTEQEAVVPCAQQQEIPMPSGKAADLPHTREPAVPSVSTPAPLPDACSLPPAVEQPPGQVSYGGLTLIGQFLNLYLLCEHDGQLVVIDQHAAHERILFQRLRQGFQEQSLVSQSLLFPVTLELEPDHADILEKEEAAVAALGVTAEFFGDTTWVIKAVPALVGSLSPREVLTDILDGLASRATDSSASVVPECVDTLLASMACKAAIKAGNRLQPEEMLDLLRRMEESEVFSHCPHGRPVIKTFSRQEIEKWFHRT
jgi:DNA mismatch repair protein MutL